MSSEKLSYSIKEAIVATGLGRSLLYEAIADGRLEKTKIGSRTLILRADLMKFLESGKEAA